MLVLCWSYAGFILCAPPIRGTTQILIHTKKRGAEASLIFTSLPFREGLGLDPYLTIWPITV